MIDFSELSEVSKHKTIKMNKESYSLFALFEQFFPLLIVHVLNENDFFLLKNAAKRASIQHSNTHDMEIIEACSSNSSLNEDIIYISIGCSVEAIESIDQQFPRGLSKFANIQVRLT